MARSEQDFQAADGLDLPHPQTSLHWGRFLILLAIGASLCVSAFIAEGRGWSGLVCSALLDIGIAVGLVGVLMVLQRYLVKEVERRFEGIAIDCYARNSTHDSDGWSVSTTANPDEVLEFMIRFENVGNTTLRNVVVGDNLPQFTRYVDGSTRLRNGANPDGAAIGSDNLTRGGIDVGSYEPGAVGYVTFSARTDPVSAYEHLGTYALSNVAVVRPEGFDERFNTARISIDVPG